MWTFEPSAALEVYLKMIEPENINIVYSERLDRQNGVKKNGTEITEIVMESGSRFRNVH